MRSSVSPPGNPSEPVAAVTGATTLTGLSFSTKSLTRPYDLLPADFVLLDDHFGLDASTWTAIAGGAGSTAFANGVLTITGTKELTAPLIAKVPYLTAIIDVGAESNAGGTNFIQVGLYKDATHKLSVGFNKTTNLVYLSFSNGGASNDTTVAKTLTVPFRLAFVLTQDCLTAWTNSNDAGWVYVGKTDVTALSLKTPATLATYKAYLASAQGAAETTGVDRIRFGYFGAIGLQNPMLVTYEDGTPITDGAGSVFVSWTNAAVGNGSSASVPALHLGIWKYNPALQKLTPVSKLFFNRGGLVYGDCAAKILYDRTAATWRIVAGDWGSFTTAGAAVSANLFNTTLNPLVTGGVFVLSGGTSISTLSTHSFWDIDLVLINGVWRLLFTDSDALTSYTTFYPALATSPDLATFTRVATLSAATAREGSRIVKVGGVNYAVYGIKNAGTFFAYDMSTLATVGALTADVVGLGPAGHFCMIPVQAGGRTRYQFLSFDDTAIATISYSHGNLIIQESSVDVAGYEFPQTVFRRATVAF